MKEQCTGIEITALPNDETDTVPTGGRVLKVIEEKQKDKRLFPIVEGHH